MFRNLFGVVCSACLVVGFGYFVLFTDGPRDFAVVVGILLLVPAVSYVAIEVARYRRGSAGPPYHR